MKRPRVIRGVAFLAIVALLLAAALRAQPTSFTATGWVNAVLAPGIICTNALGQVIYRGGVHTARVQSPDTRLTGQAFIITDGGVNADGTMNLQGPAYLQVGTWDPAGTNFTPGGAMWDMNWSGIMQTDYSLQLNIAGYGVGGSIDSLRIEQTLSRAPAGGPVDFTVPYLYAGTVKPPPLSTTLISNDFSHGVAGWTMYKNAGAVTVNAVNGQLVAHADWTGASPDIYQNFFFFAYSGPGGSWSLADGQTLECRTDLLGISQDTTNTAILGVGSPSALYGFHISRHAAFLLKWPAGADHTAFWCDNTVELVRTNLVQSITLTRDRGNAIITTRVLDKSNQDTVLFERSFVDTPQVDGTLTAAQFIALTGITTIPLAPDSGPPILSGTGALVGVFQLTDGHQPPVDALWDNFSLRLHDVPPLNISRAAQLTYPAPAGVSYLVEGAPTLQGPWLPLQNLAMPGLNQMTVPMSSPAQFFRLVQAP
jgi:hypothetical protein